MPTPLSFAKKVWKSFRVFGSSKLLPLIAAVAIIEFLIDLARALYFSAAPILQRSPEAVLNTLRRTSDLSLSDIAAQWTSPYAYASVLEGLNMLTIFSAASIVIIGLYFRKELFTLLRLPTLKPLVRISVIGVVVTGILSLVLLSTQQALIAALGLTVVFDLLFSFLFLILYTIAILAVLAYLQNYLHNTLLRPQHLRDLVSQTFRPLLVTQSLFFFTLPVFLYGTFITTAQTLQGLYGSSAQIVFNEQISLIIYNTTTVLNVLISLMFLFAPAVSVIYQPHSFLALVRKTLSASRAHVGIWILSIGSGIVGSVVIITVFDILRIGLARALLHFDIISYFEPLQILLNSVETFSMAGFILIIFMTIFLHFSELDLQRTTK
jgi:hypothetical protein